MSEYDPKQETAFWMVPRNPCLQKEHELKYARDSHEYKTIGDIARDLRRAVLGGGATDEELGEIIDREFLYGAWKDIVERLPMSGSLFLRDIRGMLVGLARDTAGHGDADRVSDDEIELVFE